MKKKGISQEIYRLQKEIEELKKKNKNMNSNILIQTSRDYYFDSQTDRYNNSTYKNKNFPSSMKVTKNNSPLLEGKSFISLYSSRRNSKPRDISKFLNIKKKEPLKPKKNPKVKRGMFSYHHQLIPSADSNLFSSKKEIRQGKKFNNNSLNCSSIFQNLRLKFFEDEENDSILEKKKKISSIDLNQYKINTDNTKLNLGFIEPNEIKLEKDNFIQETERSFISSNNTRISPILSKNITKNNFINSIQTNNEFSNRVIESNNFEGKTKSERESRRMCVEYVKLLKGSSIKSVEDILSENNISSVVLNQAKIYDKISSNFYPNESIENKYFKNNFFYPPQIYFRSSLNDSKDSLHPINKFLTEMNDISKEKTELVNFMVVPRKMDMIINNKPYAFIFSLSPTNVSFKKGIEFFLFKWSDLTGKVLGGFNLIKVNSCIVDPRSPSHFKIETNDGVKTRNYEISCVSLEDCSQYVRGINYLTQLVKCKTFGYNISLIKPKVNASQSMNGTLTNQNRAVNISNKNISINNINYSFF